ncbi:MAG: hypothetical protein KGL59_01535 [Acidobacteriota bacterium]|nr:hypothetical protein [Acidobacteriota bacterium]
MVVTLAFLLPGPLLLSRARPAASQAMPVRIALRVSTRSSVGPWWTIEGAALQEQILGTTAYLNVRNASDSVLDRAVFAANYYDASGRKCFSLLFSVPDAWDLQRHSNAAIPPRETRTLVSVADGMFPATRPSEVVVGLVRSGEPNGEALPEGSVPIRVPATIFPYGNWTADQAARIVLGPQVTRAKQPVIDLLLAEVIVDQNGAPSEVNVENSADAAVTQWFAQLASRWIDFYPASKDGVPEAGPMLILVAALPSERVDRNWPFLPQQNTRIRSYVRAQSGDSLPPVTVVFLSPRAPVVQVANPSGHHKTWVRRAVAPGTFEVESSGWDWSGPAFEWVGDRFAPGHYARRLVVDRPN